MEKIGKFEIIEVVGEGGMGVVYKARDPLIEREVAIKVIIERALEMPEIKERFYREARSAGKLSHENITVVHEVGEVDGNPYIVMEYLEGEELSHIIKNKQTVPLQEKVKYAIQICHGLQYAHSKKIVHRDIKPDNIIVLRDGKIKIMDFGIAKPETSNLTQTGMMVGTLSYMSPEQVKGAKIDNRSDIFSFGVLFYELLTYKRPFLGNSTTIMYKIVHEEPEKIQIEDHELLHTLQEILTRCLQKNPDDRYASCSELAQELEKLISLKGIRSTIEELLDQGRTLCAEKSPEALARFDEVLKIDPKNEEAKSLKQKCLGDIDTIDTILVGDGTKKPEKRVVAKPKHAPEKQSRKGVYAFIAALLVGAVGAFMFRVQVLELIQGNPSEKNTAAIDQPQTIENTGQATSDPGENLGEESMRSEPDPDLAPFKSAASIARDNALKVQSSAAKDARKTKSYGRAVAALSLGNDEFNKENFEKAEINFLSAAKLFGKAIVEARDLRIKTANRAQLMSEARNAEQDVKDAQSEADRVDAKSIAREAYRYASNKLTEGKQRLGKGKYSEAIQRYEEARSGFSLAVNEKIVIDKSSKMYQVGDYQKCLDELAKILTSSPYDGENRKARELYREVDRAHMNRAHQIENAKNAADNGNLTSAFAVLRMLPERDQSYFEVRDLKKTIIGMDKTAPVIQHSEEKSYDPQEPLKIVSTVQDNLALKDVSLFYVRRDAKTFSVGMMKPGGKGVYEYVIPQDYHKGKEIKYYFIATDANGNKQNLKTKKKPYKIKSKSKSANIPQIP